MIKNYREWKTVKAAIYPKEYLPHIDVENGL
jgi:hypothetical protein